MPREINQTQPFSNKVVKFIPTEVVGGYMMLAGFLGFGPGAVDGAKVDGILIQVVFFFLLAFTPVYLWFIGEVRNIVQIGVATVSYVVWVYSLGGPFEVWGCTTHPQIAAVVMALWTFIPPLFVHAAQPLSAEEPAHP